MNVRLLSNMVLVRIRWLVWVYHFVPLDTWMTVVIHCQRLLWERPKDFVWLVNRWGRRNTFGGHGSWFSWVPRMHDARRQGVNHFRTLTRFRKELGRKNSSSFRPYKNFVRQRAACDAFHRCVVGNSIMLLSSKSICNAAQEKSTETVINNTDTNL